VLFFLIEEPKGQILVGKKENKYGFPLLARMDDRRNNQERESGRIMCVGHIFCKKWFEKIK